MDRQGGGGSKKKVHITLLKRKGSKEMVHMVYWYVDFTFPLKILNNLAIDKGK